MAHSPPRRGKREFTSEMFLEKVRGLLEARQPRVHRPFPIKIGGKQLDLFLLLEEVNSRGGYAKTSVDGKWGHIATNLGLLPHCGPSVKLVYLKYLKPFISLFKHHNTTANAKENCEQDASRKKKHKISNPSQSSPKKRRLQVAPTPSGFEKSLQWLKKLALSPLNSTHNPSFQYSLNTIRHMLAGDNRKVKRKHGLCKPRIGPKFQVEIPEALNSVNREESLAYLGTTIWPQQVEHNGSSKASTSMIRCCCLEKGSLKCVNFHVEESKQRLQAAIGKVVFKSWGFDRTGERVSQAWSIEEQDKFNYVFVRSNKVGVDPWLELHKAFPHKTRPELVSFYFNVFILHRRAIQNRVGMEPDSDNDEDELQLPNILQRSGDVIILD